MWLRHFGHPGGARGGVIVLALAGMLASQSSFGDRRAGSRPVVHPATVAILNLQHKSLPGFFVGLRPNPLLSIQDVLARQHPAPKCAASSARSSPLPWFERLLGMTTVHAQQGNCTGQYCCSYCLDTSNICGQGYPYCYNGGS